MLPAGGALDHPGVSPALFMCIPRIPVEQANIATMFPVRHQIPAIL
jgi:hypothetical protein